MEKMRGKIVFFALALFLVLPSIAAVKTDITVKTDPNALILLYVSDPVSEERLFQAYEPVNENGVYTTSVSVDLKEINIELKALDKSNIILGEYEVENYEVGEPLVLDFRKTVEEDLNATANEETETTNETIDENPEENINESLNEEPITNESQTGITGNVITRLFENETARKIVFYVIGGLVLVAILGFVVARGMNRRKSSGVGSEPKQIKVTKLSDVKKEQKDDDEDPRVKAAEEKIKEAQIELKKIKNDEKVKAMEKKIEEDRERLEKLKAGEED